MKTFKIIFIQRGMSQDHEVKADGVLSAIEIFSNSGFSIKSIVSITCVDYFEN